MNIYSMPKPHYQAKPVYVRIYPHVVIYIIHLILHVHKVCEYNAYPRTVYGYASALEYTYTQLRQKNIEGRKQMGEMKPININQSKLSPQNNP